MISRIRGSLRRGTEKIQWFSRLFSERLRIEVAVFRLMYESDEMARQKDEGLKKLGERIFELKSHPEKDVFKDRIVVETIAEIEKLENTVQEIHRKATEISRSGA